MAQNDSLLAKVAHCGGEVAPNGRLLAFQVLYMKGSYTGLCKVADTMAIFGIW